MDREADGTLRADAGRVPERRGRLASPPIVDGLATAIEHGLGIRAGEYDGWLVTSAPGRGWVAIDVRPSS
jgi:hypothetical protein